MTDDRHNTLIREGWRYDAKQDRYTNGESVNSDVRWYNLDAAWRVHSSPKTIVHIDTTPPTRSTPIRDPRKQEPQ